MLFTDIVELQSSADNYGATITETGIGTDIPGNASANTKSNPVTLISGASVTDNVVGIGITFSNGFTSAAVRRFLADILIDQAGGTSWSVFIPNLFVNSPSLAAGGYRYFFPLFIPAGSSIGAQQQCSTGSISLRCAVQLYTRPTNPYLWKVGTYVETFGANTGTTSGTAVTPGNGATGTYVSVGTTARELWWWQWGGVGVNDTTVTPKKMLMGDVACGDATFKKLCLDSCIQNVDTNEQFGKECLGLRPPARKIAAGETVYVRVTGSGSADTTNTTIAYGVGGG